MKDKYGSFAELKKHRPKSFTINLNVRESSVLIFTPHGGGIEPGTTEICEWFNKNDFSYYSFNGIGRNCRDLHITSTRFDEPKLREILTKHQFSISFHGMKDSIKREFDADIFLGGRYTVLVNSLKKKLRESGFSVTSAEEYPNSNLGALSSDNVTNKCVSGKGVQIELSESIRKTFFKNDYRFMKGRAVTTARFEEFCSLISEELKIIKMPPESTQIKVINSYKLF